MSEMHVSCALVAPLQDLNTQAGQAAAGGETPADAFALLLAETFGEAGLELGAEMQAEPQARTAKKKEPSESDAAAMTATLMALYPQAMPAEVARSMAGDPADAAPGTAPRDAAVATEPRRPAKEMAAAKDDAKSALPEAEANSLAADPTQAVAPVQAMEVTHAAPHAALPEALPAVHANEATAATANVQAPTEAQAASKPHPVHIAAPISSPRWSEEVGNTVRLLATRGIEKAEIHVQPAELGPVQLSLCIDAGDASLALAAPHAETRQALESALPKLREMLAAEGLSLGEASVNDSGAFEQRGEQQASRSQRASHAPESAVETAETALPGTRPRGLVDTFA